MSAANLDLFSTSQSEAANCAYSAPYFAYELSAKRWAVAQGNCHHWDCPKCGEGRAKQEYGRIVEGCRTLEKEHALYFITVTCKGREMKLADALQQYGKWTNHLLTIWRADAKKRGIYWAYVQVTEQQGRGHPHSHILTTYYPSDLREGKRAKYVTDNMGRKTKVSSAALRSDALEYSVIRAGLGKEYDVSMVDKIEGASRYVAKYLFHPDMFMAKYPKGWKRVRYSQSFPNLQDRQTNAMVLLKREDWSRLSVLALVVRCKDAAAWTEAQANLRGSDTVVIAPNVLTGIDI